AAGGRPGPPPGRPLDGLRRPAGRDPRRRQPRRSGLSLSLGDTERPMRRYRFLFEQLVRRELRQKYQGSALGLAWYLVNPLVLMGAYYLLFGVIFRQTKVPDYPLFLIVGLVVWLFFSQSLLSAASSLLDQGSLIRKARFPRET